jgi:hypothetical protein
LILFHLISLLGLDEIAYLVIDDVALLEVLNDLVAQGQDFADFDVGFLQLGLGEL